MKKLSKLITVCVLCLMISHTAYSQETKAVIPDASVDWYYLPEEEQIVVTYDLIKAHSLEQFEISLEFETGTSERIIPVSMEGDIGAGITGGKRKKIYWDVLNDVDEIAGEIKAIVNIISVTRIYGGPANALLSMPVPGLGDYYVANPREMIFKPYIKTILAYGLVGAGAYLELDAKRIHDEYMNKEINSKPDEKDCLDLYDQANSKHHTAFVLMGTGIAIWAYDVVWGTIKGAKNAKENKYKFQGKIDKKLMLGYDQYGPNVKFVIRF